MAGSGVTFDNTTVTTIVRFHRRERLPLLAEAIASLSAQEWQDLEVVVTLQNPDRGLVGEVERIVRRQPWPAPPRFQIIKVDVPPGVDGRSDLLNRGLALASGRFLAFLDDDDVVYPHGYATLVRQLLAGGRAVAVGGYCKSYLRREAEGWRVMARESAAAHDASRLTLFRYNFVPLHSYVIDRSRLGGYELYFDDELPPAEDYDFLLRLFAAFEPDFSRYDVAVCEYRVHDLNSIGRALDYPDERPPALSRALSLIEERKKTLRCVVTAGELAALTEDVARLRGESERMLCGLARRANGFIDRHPGVKAWLRRVRATALKAHRR